MSRRSRSSRSMWPSASSAISTTVAIDSRHGSSLEWCSYGPTNTTGRSPIGMCSESAYRSSRTAGRRIPRIVMSRSMAPVEPEPAKITACSSEVPPTHVRMMSLGVLSEPGGLAARFRGLGVGVGIHRHHLVVDQVLDEGQRPPRGRVVGVGDPTRSVWSRHCGVRSDDRSADRVDELGRIHGDQATGCSPCGSLRIFTHKRQHIAAFCASKPIRAGVVASRHGR